MFLENFGKLFFLKMRPFFFFALVFFPLLAAGLYLFLESSKLQSLEERFDSAVRKQRLFAQKEARKKRFLERYSNPDPYFLDREIESFPLLQNEKNRLLSLLDHPAFANSPLIKNRLKQIEKNSLAFTEKNILTSSSMKETEETLRYPIQMDEHDLKTLLALIEDVSDKTTPRPQILIKDFFLKKIQTPLQTEVFEVEMNLLKREFNEKV